MFQNLTWRKAALAFTVTALLIIGYSYVKAVLQWMVAEQGGPGSFEPFTVLLNVFWAVLWAGFEWLRRTKVPDIPIPWLQHHTPPVTLGVSNWQRNRQNVLQNMQATWIDGYLRHTVHEEVYLLLGMEYKPEAVLRRPWNLELQPDSQPVPDDKSIYDIYAEHGRNLLILGEPASGKTITLLQLAETLILDAQTNDLAPIPIIVNLSSWARERHSLSEWLVEELLLQYQMSRELTKEWLAQNLLTFLLDGLDEVATEHRDACVEAINKFKEAFTASIVVCSRIADYENLQKRLNLTEAIVLKPLTQMQIEDYLEEFGDRTQGIQKAIHYEQSLQELTESPLMLSLMPIAYDGVDYQELVSGASAQEQRKRLFHSYVDRVFIHRHLPEGNAYDKEQALSWLVNLAQGMQEHGQSIFYIERLQPSWIPGQKLRYRLIFGLIFGLIFVLIFGIEAFINVRETNQHSLPNQGIRASFRNACLYALILGPILGMIFVLIFWLSGVLTLVPFLGPTFGVIFGVIFGVSFGLSGVLMAGLFFGLLGGFLQYGGEAVFQHYALRFLMAHHNILPYPFRDKRLVAYLDAMAERVLLRRVGGGWIFIHRYLLEYFAEQHPDYMSENDLSENVEGIG